MMILVMSTTPLTLSMMLTPPTPPTPPNPPTTCTSPTPPTPPIPPTPPSYSSYSIRFHDFANVSNESDSSRTSSRVKHRPARYETKFGTPISRRSRSKQRAQRRLQLWILEKHKHAERNRGSQQHQTNSVKLFKVAFRVGGSTVFLEE